MYPKLEEIGLHHQSAFLNAMSDYEQNDPKMFKILYPQKDSWTTKAFAKYVAECQKQKQDWRPGPNKISTTTYVLLESQDVICGFGRMRFPLTDKTEKHGGNLEFDVPPSRRGQGYGALTLNRMLFEAVRAGLARVLLTCPTAQLAAIKCIEKNRGVFKDEIYGLEDLPPISRFWINFR